MLYVCPTPIGNLKDVTLRVLEVLEQVELIACEDTRRTRILLDRYGVAARVISFHDYNEEQRLATLLPLLREGRDVAMVSDAGMPGLSDPGFSLVRACAAEDIPVTVLPGPSSISTALVLSGLPADRFAFVGFLARGEAKLVSQLLTFEGSGAALIAFESPRRLRGSLAVIAKQWPGRRLAVCRELTKMHEEVIRGTPEEVMGRLGDVVRGEIVLVLEAAGGSPVSAARECRVASRQGLAEGAASTTSFGISPGAVEVRAREALARLFEEGLGTKAAAGVVANLTGLSARRAYALALEARRDSE